MKNLLKVGMALLIIAMMFGMAGCFEPGEDEDKGSGVDFKNYTGADQAVRFRNDAGVRVVLFGNSIAKDNILGGIDVGAVSGLSKSNNTKHFGQTGAFPIVVVPEKQYIDNKNDLAKIVPLTTLYVFYNAQGTNDNIYEVSGRLGGNQYSLEIVMPVTGTWNAEFREGGIVGTPIGYAQAGMLITKLFIQPEEQFNLFPVFHRWNSIRQVLDIAYPKTAPNSASPQGEAMQITVALSSEYPTLTVNMREALERLQTTKPNVGAAYVNIRNQVEGGMIHMTRGGQPVRNPLGISAFGAGTRTFRIDMEEVIANSGNFAPSASFDGYRFGVVGNERQLVVQRDATDTETTINLDNGWIYQLTVIGNALSDPSGIVPTLDLRSEGSTRKTEFDWTGVQ